MSIYDTEDSVQKSFNENFIPEEQLQTQWAEFIELKKVIAELSFINKRAISILDIGIGDGRIVKHLCGIKEIWDSIAAYHGIDNAEPCLAISNKVIKRLNIKDKVSVGFLEARQLNTLTAKYDMVITTWFTAGNFYPDDFPFETYKESGEKIDLAQNKRFEKVFSDAYDLLNPGGEIVLGSCYIDNENTRKKQEAFYEKMGMEVITDAEDTFTATRQKFWSQRFTRQKLQNYLGFVKPEKIICTALDTYDFAMQVRIKK
jgi:SAM-dependent methyltransferase